MQNRQAHKANIHKLYELEDQELQTKKKQE